MPAYVVDLLSPAVGDPGDSAANFSGGIALTASMSTPGDQVVVEALSETAAIQAVLTGTITATVGGQSASYTPGPSTIGTSTSSQLPFVLVATATPGRYELWLEDLATMPGGTPDWDYNDRWWLIQVRPPGPAQGDLDIVDSSGDVVPEQQENNPGGYVAVNNDNDNDNFAPAASRFHVYDKDENGKVEGENDLVKIVVKDLAYQNNDPTTGNFTLTWASTKIKVWKSADKDAGAFFSGTQVAPGAALTLWVEGLDVSATVGAESITLNWNPAGGTTTAMDSVDFTVYKVEGVMNVPGYSVHTYRITEPVTTAFGAGGAPTQTSTVTHGTEKTAANLYTGIFPGMTSAILTRTITVLWGEGARQGIVRFNTAAAPTFYTNREVNVVKMEFETVAGDDNKVTYRNPPVQANVVGLPKEGVVSIDRVSNGPNKGKSAIEATVKLKSIVGPTVNGAMRGTRFVETGLIQNIRSTKAAGVFSGFPTVKRRVPSFSDGKFYWDTASTTNSDSMPYYIRTADGFYAQTTELGINDPSPSKVFTIQDTPARVVTDTMKLTIDTVEKPVTDFELLDDFFIYAAVRTSDTGIGSGTPTGPDMMYTQRGVAKWWFDGSGTVTPAGVWEAITGTTKNDGDTSFTAVTDGSVVPVTDGPPFNLLLVQGGFTFRTVG